MALCVTRYRGDNGRGERIRTFDPLFPKQMRYQAALRPDWRLSTVSKTI